VKRDIVAGQDGQHVGVSVQLVKQLHDQQLVVGVSATRSPAEADRDYDIVGNTLVLANT
jgi:hypothetical protein